MSLINQVLQDLDRRHASAAGVPSAVKALPPAAGRARYARVVAIVAVAVVVVGGAAGAMAWSMGVRSAQVAAVAPLGDVAPVAVAAPTPGVVMVAAPPSAGGRMPGGG